MDFSDVLVSMVDQSNVYRFFVYACVFLFRSIFGMPTFTILEQNRTVVVWLYIEPL